MAFCIGLRLIFHRKRSDEVFGVCVRFGLPQVYEYELNKMQVEKKHRSRDLLTF